MDHSWGPKLSSTLLKKRTIFHFYCSETASATKDGDANYYASAEHKLIVLALQENSEGYDGSCGPGPVLGKQSACVLLSQGDWRAGRGWLAALCGKI